MCLQKLGWSCYFGVFCSLPQTQAGTWLLFIPAFKEHVFEDEEGSDIPNRIRPLWALNLHPPAWCPHLNSCWLSLPPGWDPVTPFTIAQGAGGRAWNEGWRVGAWPLGFRPVEPELAQPSMSLGHLSLYKSVGQSHLCITQGQVLDEHRPLLPQDCCTLPAPLHPGAL